MKTFTLPRIKCIKPVEPEYTTRYSLFKLVDGNWIRVASTSYSDVKLALNVYLDRIGTDFGTYSIREVRKPEVKEAGLRWKASWSLKDECKWLLRN